MCLQRPHVATSCRGHTWNSGEDHLQSDPAPSRLGTPGIGPPPPCLLLLRTASGAGSWAAEAPGWCRGWQGAAANGHVDMGAEWVRSICYKVSGPGSESWLCHP